MGAKYKRSVNIDIWEFLYYSSIFANLKKCITIKMYQQQKSKSKCVKSKIFSQNIYVNLHFAEAIFYVTVSTKHQSMINQNAEVGTVTAILQVRKQSFRDCLIHLPKITAINGGVGTQIRIGCSLNLSAKIALDVLTKMTQALGGREEHLSRTYTPVLLRADSWREIVRLKGVSVDYSQTLPFLRCHVLPISNTVNLGHMLFARATSVTALLSFISPSKMQPASQYSACYRIGFPPTFFPVFIQDVLIYLASFSDCTGLEKTRDVTPLFFIDALTWVDVEPSRSTHRRFC